MRLYYQAGELHSPLMVRCERLAGETAPANITVARATNAPADAGTWSPPWKPARNVQRKLTRDEWDRLDELAAAFVNETDAGPHGVGSSATFLDGANADFEVARHGRYRSIERSGRDTSMLSPLERQMLRLARRMIGKEGEFLRVPAERDSRCSGPVTRWVHHDAIPTLISSTPQGL